MTTDAIDFEMIPASAPMLPAIGSMLTIKGKRYEVITAEPASEIIAKASRGQVVASIGLKRPNAHRAHFAYLRPWGEVEIIATI